MSDLWGLVPIDDAGRIAGDLACAQCGYNLRGALLRGDCPECGATVDAAVERARNLRRESNTLLMTVSGMGWLITAGVVPLVYALLVTIAPLASFLVCVGVPAWVTFVIALPVGLWLVTEPRDDDFNRLRLLVRLAMVATMCGMLLLFAGVVVSFGPVMFVAMPVVCTGLFAFGGAIYTLSRSLGAVGGRRLQPQLRIVGLLVFAMCMTGIAMIVFMPLMVGAVSTDMVVLITNVIGGLALIFFLWLLPLLILIRRRALRIARAASEGRFG